MLARWRQFATNASEDSPLTLRRKADPMSDFEPCPPRPVRIDAGLPIVWVAAAALVDPQGRVLLTERPAGKSMAGMWEFPGGKMEPGEIPEAALRRELYEELGLDVCISCMHPFAFASHSYETFHLAMPLFVVRRWDGVPRAREGQRLQWVPVARLGEHAMPPADRPLVSQLQDWLL
ncbi:MAG: (deoxy)nucleoside triphosphate pyrophosphohydrolase [Alphaproteobacteria bacterium]|nr:MAG: (deoxy)nucleoside triphosphate pyrophosphohydrolase [Alphaproteobacteria bacterium]